MAQKTITELPLRDDVTDEVNFPVDDTVQTYRVTALQIFEYILAAGNVVLTMLDDAIFYGLSTVTAAAGDFLTIVDISDSNKTKKVLVSDIASPSGVISAYGGSSAPTGWLLCDGTSYLRATYPDLYAAVGNAFGTVDGTHFNVPDLRGRFLRGVDGAAGRDPDDASRTAMNTGGNTGDNVGSVQGDEVGPHSHAISASTTNSSGSTGAAVGGSGSISGTTLAHTNYQSLAPSGGQKYIQDNSGAESRPINAGVQFIIKI